LTHRVILLRRKDNAMADAAVNRSLPAVQVHTQLSRQQITGFWGAWAGWTLDGMDSVIYALVLSPALTELLPKSGYKATPANVGFAGSTLFALFLVGWGLSLVWGPIADRFGRSRVLAATILVYAIFTGAAALSQTVWQLGLFRLLAGIGIGGEWALAGTYVAEAWPEDRRKMGAGYLQTGYYAGFFLASALNYTVAARYGWRAMFWCGLTPVVVALMVLLRVREPERWQKTKVKTVGGISSLRRIFSPPYTQRTLVNTVLLASAICGLWAAAVYAPTAIISLAKRAGMSQPEAVRMSSFGMGLLSLGTILGCLAVRLLHLRDQAEFLELVTQSVAADIQQFGGVGLVAVGLAHGQFDHGVFHFFERRPALRDVKPRQHAAVGQLSVRRRGRSSFEDSAAAGFAHGKGRYTGRRNGSSSRIMPRSMVFFNSRTLPGQLWLRMRRRVSSVMPRIDFLKRRL
jgi:MFS family permease